MESTQLVGLVPTLFIMIIAIAATVALLRWPAAIAFLTARLGEPSTKGAMIFCVNAIYGVMTGALDTHAFLLVMMQGAYHILQPDSGIPVSTLTATAELKSWEMPLAELSDTAKQFITDAVAAGKSVAPLALCLIFAVSLSSCSTLQGLTGDPSKDLPAIGSNITATDATAQKSIAAISKFTVTDLQDADADAVANSDTAAHSCYQALIPVVQSRANAAAPAVGAISAFQRTRDLVKLVKGQGSIAQACAALKQDMTGDVLGLGALFGVP